jgi:hypothetical protein
MSDNHVDIFVNSRDEISIDVRGNSPVIKLGGTVKIFLISSNFTLDQFMDKLNETYRQATARKESKDGGKTDKHQPTRERKVKT